MSKVNVTHDGLVKLLKLASTTIRDLDTSYEEMSKLARAMAIVEPLMEKGLLSNIVGKSIYKTAQELTKKSDKELETLEYMAQNSPQKYAGLGATSDTPSRSGNITARIDRLVMGKFGR